MTQDEMHRFQTFGFLQCKQLLSPKETQDLSVAFDAAMERAERNRPTEDQKRQQVIPFFDYDPDSFYPLLDDARFIDIFETLMGEDFIFTASEGIIHIAGSPWHHDACAPEGIFSMRAAIYLDPLGPNDGCLNVISGSHFKEFRESIKQTIDRMGLRPEDLPGLVLDASPVRIIASVSGAKPRAQIRAALDGMEYREGRDYVCAA